MIGIDEIQLGESLCPIKPIQQLASKVADIGFW